jgi:hypothetical protein
MVSEIYREDDVGSFAGHSVSTDGNEEINLFRFLVVIHLRTVNHR